MSQVVRKTLKQCPHILSSHLSSSVNSNLALLPFSHYSLTKKSLLHAHMCFISASVCLSLFIIDGSRVLVASLCFHCVYLFFKSYKERKRETDLHAGSLPRWLQLPTLGQAEAKSFFVSHVGGRDPNIWAPSHYFFQAIINTVLDQDLNSCPYGMLDFSGSGFICHVTTLALIILFLW